MSASVLKSPFNRDEQFEAKKRAVITNAATAFRRRGYHNTSMTDIAETLGLTKAALYYYVSNKEEILYESHLMTYASMDEILRLRSNGASGIDQVETQFRAFIKLLTETGASLLTDINSLNGDRREDILARRAKIERAILETVMTGQSDGSIREGDPRLHVFFFMGALNWLNAWYDAQGHWNGDDIADHFARQLRQGIAINGDING